VFVCAVFTVGEAVTLSVTWHTCTISARELVRSTGDALWNGECMWCQPCLLQGHL